MEYSGPEVNFSFWKWVAYDSTTKVMQFIGCLDANKKEIYEDDIVEASIYTDEKPQVLEVRRERCCFVIDYADSESDFVPVCWFEGQLKVIGNIYETPKLLEG